MQRKALVFGLSDYPGDDALPNAGPDAERVVSALGQRGFECVLVKDGRMDTMMAALAAFQISCQGADLALIYYAGHAMEHWGAGFVLPTDMPPLSASVLRTLGIPIAHLVDSMDGAAIRLVVLDACREAPLDDDMAGVINELRPAEQDWDNVLIAYSTSASDLASDGAKGVGSRFCTTFCETLLRHDLSVEDCFRDIGSEVMRQSQRRQRPWSYSSLNDRVTFSDLPPFQLVQTHPTGLEGSIDPLSLVQGGKGEVIAFGGRRSIWRATIKSKFDELATEHTLVCGVAAVTPTKLAVLDQSGQLRLSGKGVSVWFDTGMKDAFGLHAAPAGDVLAILSPSHVMLVRLAKSGPVILFKRRVTRAAYAVAFPARRLAWFCGEGGTFLEVDWSGRAPTARALRGAGVSVNAVVHRPGKTYCAGHDGRIWLRTENKPSKPIEPFVQLSRWVETPLARRGSLVSTFPDTEIAKLLFSPQSLNPRQRERLEDGLESNRLTWIDHAPTRPILIASNNEGLIYVIDSRDGQLVQKIDASAGRDHEVQGLRFLADDRFAALGKDGAIRFYGSA